MIFKGIFMDDYLRVGAVTTAHGVKGELKVFPTTDDPGRFKKLKSLMVEKGKDFTEFKVQSVKFFKQFVILKFEGIDTMNDALLYKGADLYVSRKNAVKLEKDEYFITDLIGLEVYDENNDHIGVISEVYQTGANDVYEIKVNDEKSFLLPAIKECVLNVDIKGGKITVHILEGLMD